MCLLQTCELVLCFIFPWDQRQFFPHWLDNKFILFYSMYVCAYISIYLSSCMNNTHKFTHTLIGKWACYCDVGLQCVCVRVSLFGPALSTQTVTSSDYLSMYLLLHPAAPVGQAGPTLAVPPTGVPHRLRSPKETQSPTPSTPPPP